MCVANGSGPCAARWTTCDGNMECKKLYDCWKKCSESSDVPKCHDDCIMAHPGGENDFNDYNNCFKTECKTACSTSLR